MTRSSSDAHARENDRADRRRPSVVPGVARIALEADGFVVVGTATDGESAVAETLRLEPDIVLLDVGLPDIDGFEVAARLREAGSPAAIVLASSRDGSDFGTLVAESGARGLIDEVPALRRCGQSPRRSEPRDAYSRTTVIDLVVATPVFLDLTFVGLESLPGLGEERFAAELLRTPGGGAITAVAAARLGLSAAVAAPLGEDVAGDLVRGALADEGVAWIGTRPAPRTPTTVVMPFGGDRAMVTSIRARAPGRGRRRPRPRAVAASLDQLFIVPDGSLAFVTCGDDDGRAYAGRPPAALGGARALFVNQREALVLTRRGHGRPTQPRRLAELAETVVVTLAGEGAVAFSHGEDRGSRASRSPTPSTRPAPATCSPPPTSGPTSAAPSRPTGSSWAVLYAALAVDKPTGIGGA